MTNVIEIRSETNESEGRATLDALCLEGARQMLHKALEVEVTDYLERHHDARDEKGHARVTRNGKARPRQVTSGAGTMTVELAADQATVLSEEILPSPYSGVFFPARFWRPLSRACFERTWRIVLAANLKK